MIKHVVLIACSLLMIYPLLWMLVSSFRPTNTIFRSPGLWLHHPTLANYTHGWNALTSPFGQYLINSGIVVVGAILGNVVSCSLAAYAFARLKFRGRTLWFAIMLLSIMLPIHVVVVPQYIIFNNLGWVNTFIPLVLPKFLATDAFFVFLMVQFMRGVPRELDEAARLDGATVFQELRYILVPYTGKTIGVVTILMTFESLTNVTLPLIISDGGPNNATNVYALRVLNEAFTNYHFGVAAAIGVAIFLLNLGVVIACIRNFIAAEHARVS